MLTHTRGLWVGGRGSPGDSGSGGQKTARGGEYTRVRLRNTIKCKISGLIRLGNNMPASRTYVFYMHMEIKFLAYDQYLEFTITMCFILKVILAKFMF